MRGPAGMQNDECRMENGRRRGELDPPPLILHSSFIILHSAFALPLTPEYRGEGGESSQMRIRDPIIEEEPYNLVPLTDMVFNLLIFFMAATTFTQIEKDLAVQLPKAGGFQTLSAAPKQIVINIREDGSTYVDGRQRTNEQLSEMLSAAVKTDPGREVLIRVDERS